MPVINTTLNISLSTLTSILSILSFVIPFTLLPLILSIDIARFLFTPLCEEAARTIHKANWYWGIGNPRRLLQCLQRVSTKDLRTVVSQAVQNTLAFHRNLGVIQRHRRRISTTLRHPCPMANLPPEITIQILVELLYSKDTPGTYDCTPLVLCKWYRDAFRPRVYNRIHIATHRRFRLLRETLALLNPSLGDLIQHLILAADSFDQTGYVANPIAAQPTLSTGIEQLLLSMPNLRNLSLDLYSLAALWDGHGNHRLESGPKPIRLQTELTFPQYLDLPMHEELQELDIMCFGLDASVARDLRTALPRLKRLTIRLVRREENATRVHAMPTAPRNGVHALAGQVASQSPAFQTGSNDEDELATSTSIWSDTLLGHKDADAFCDALDVLRSWPIDKQTKDVERAFNVHGDRLEAVTVLSWPSAVRELQYRLRHKELPTDRVCRTPGQLDAAVELHRAQMTAVLSNGNNSPPRRIPLAPLRVDLDVHRNLGPRRGCVMAWVQDA